MHKLFSNIYSLSICYILIGLIAGPIQLFNSQGANLVSKQGVYFSASVLAACLIWSRVRKLPVLKLEPSAFLLGFLVLFLSSFLSRPFTFFNGETLRIDLVVLGLIGTSLFYLSAKKGAQPEARGVYFSSILLFFQFLISYQFLQELGDELIFRDDHPSFLYRFQLLREHFPFFPFFNTEWNLGYSAREFLPSGMLNAFFVLSPLIYFVGDIRQEEWLFLYNIFIPILYIFVIPWAVFLGARYLGFSKEAALCSAIFSLAPSFSFFEWLLKYGTIGFCFSAGLIPLALCLAIRLSLSEEEPKWSHVLCLLVASFGAISWTLASASFVPAIVFCLWYFRDVFRGARGKKVFVFALLFLVLNGPWIGVFFRESKVLEFVSGSTLPGSHSQSFHQAEIKQKKKGEKSLKLKLEKSIEVLRENIVKVHPLLLLLSLPGLFLLKRKRVSLVLLASILWLILVSVIGGALKPQLELHRMVVVAAYLMCLPTGLAVWTMLESFSKEKFKEAFTSSVFRLFFLMLLSGVVLLTPVYASSLYANRVYPFYTTAPDSFLEISRAIKKHGGDGRTFFLGFILHELGAKTSRSQDGGHIAPISKLSGKELIASDFYHTRWSTVDPIPKEYRDRGSEGIEEFLDLLYVTAVVTFKKEWTRYARDNERYREVYSDKTFHVFERVSKTTSRIHEGKGQVLPRPDGFKLIADTKRVVVSYRYHERLQSNYPEKVKIKPKYMYKEYLGGGKVKDFSFIEFEVDEGLLGKEVNVGFFP